MILSGEKKEEYREIKPYYTTRFKHLWQGSLIGYNAERRIRFRNGYAKDSLSFIARVTLDFGEGKSEWGAKKANYTTSYGLNLSKVRVRANDNR